MQSRNPVLNREFGNQQQYATFREAPAQAPTIPGATGTGGLGTGARMTIDDVVVKTAVLFVILLFGALAGWAIADRLPAAVWISALAAFGVGMVVAIRRTTNPALVMLYAALEGLFLGGISAWYTTLDVSVNGDSSNIVLQAVTGTFVAFGVMLLLYRSGKLRATPRFRRIVTGALISYLLIAVVSAMFAIFGHVGNGWGFYGVGPVGLLLCVFAVGLACLTLVLDFDAIEQGVRAGLPERESWRGAFGLMVTLVWLYLELLRLFAILNGGNR
jgi:uncharacterized YccA/Bax inhibitor family protein